MESNLNPEQARTRRKELVDSFIRMIDYAKNNGVQAILISGDLFDTNRISKLTLDRIFDAIESSSNICFFYLSGNHDAYRRFGRTIRVPENFFMFGTKGTKYQLDDIVCVSGIEAFDELTGQISYNEVAYKKLTLDPRLVNIVMMHGPLGSGQNPGEINLDELRHHNIDYLALGHYHTYSCERLDERGVYCYSGCLEGRGFDECGQKGFALLNFDGTRLTSQFVPFSLRNLHTVQVDISDLETVVDISNAISEATKSLNHRDMVNVELVGNYTTDTIKDISYLEKMFEPGFFFFKITDKSSLKIARSDFANDASLKGEYTRVVLNDANQSIDKERVLNIGIAALYNRDVIL